MNYARVIASVTTHAMALTGLLTPLACLSGDRVNMDVKLGLWEVMTRSSTSGMPELTPEMKAEMEQSQKRMNESMKSMTPEQRAKVEAALSAVTKRQGQPTQHTAQSCFTKEKMEQGDMLSGKNGMENCKSVILQNDSNNLVMKLTCTESSKSREKGRSMTTAKGAGEVLVKYTVVSSTSMRGTMDMKMDVGGGKFFSSHTDMEQRWLGVDCHGKK